jgi:hypothetical protein
MDEKNTIDCLLRSCIFTEVDDLWIMGRSKVFSDVSNVTVSMNLRVVMENRLRNTIINSRNR